MARWIIETTTNILPPTTGSTWRQQNRVTSIHIVWSIIQMDRRRRRSFLLMHFTDPSSPSLLLWTCGCCCWMAVERRPHHLTGICQSSSNSLEKRFNCPLPIAIKRFNAFNYGRQWITNLKAFFSISFNYVRWWLEISLIMPIPE